MSRSKGNIASLKISNTTNIVFNIVLALLAFACLYPLLLVFSVSITDEKSISMFGYHLIPREVSLNAYKFVFKSYASIFRAYGVTLFVTIAGSLLSICIIAMYAYPLSRSSFKHKNVFSFIVYFTMLFNGGLVPWYIVYVKLLHLKNTFGVLIIPALMGAMPVLIMRTFFRTSIPEALLDSAKIDGAGEFYTFLRIVLPLSKPVIATILLFNTLHYWNDWYLPLVFITDEKKFTLQYLLYKVEKNLEFLVNANNISSDAAAMLANVPSETSRMAIAVIAIGPIVFAYPFFQKYFVQGLTIGAVKG